MSFGVINPSVKNELVQLLSRNNEWTGIETFTRNILGTTPVSTIKLRNTTAALTGAQQVSPAVEWEGQGFTTFSSLSKKINFRQYLLPVQGSTDADGILKTQSSLNSAAYTDLLDLYTRNPDGNTGGLLLFKGSQELEFSQSNQDPGTSKALTLNNVSGSYTNINWKYAGTIKSALTISNTGDVTFKTTNGGSYYFNFGSTLSSTNLQVQIYSGGIYNQGGSFNQGKVTAGQADTTPPAYLNTYGSFAGRGTLLTGSTHTLDENQFVVYGDASTAFLCSGTPSVTACSTYTGAGQAVCESHLPCVWSNGTDCSEYNATDQSTCETGHSPCAWQSASCSGANNIDSGSCESQNTAYGGSCAWDTSTCPAQTSAAACSGITGCTSNPTGDCNTLSDGGGDGTSCATQAECSYDSGSGTCSGTFFQSGDCSGSLCNGSYYTGTCGGGSWGLGCFGTATCGDYTSSGTCLAEAGCVASSGSTWTLPLSSVANEGNVSRFHYLKNIGPSATINVVANTGDTLESAIALTSGQAALVHQYIRTADCVGFLDSSSCNAQSPCSWHAAVVCASFNGDESGCNAASGSGCSYDSGTSTCSGSGSTAVCTGGNYTVSSKWYKHESTWQPLDSDLTTIAGLTATTDNFLQAKGSAWASRTIAQVKTDLDLEPNPLMVQVFS